MNNDLTHFTIASALLLPPTIAAGITAGVTLSGCVFLGAFGLVGSTLLALWR
jgi:hypothetical protein